MFQSSGYLVGEPGSKKDRVCNVLATRLCVAKRQNFMLGVPVLGVFCRGTWMKEGRSLLCAGYASTCGYASKSKLRVPVLGESNVVEKFAKNENTPFYLIKYAKNIRKIDKVLGIRIETIYNFRTRDKLSTKVSPFFLSNNR